MLAASQHVVQSQSTVHEGTNGVERQTKRRRLNDNRGLSNFYPKQYDNTTINGQGAHLGDHIGDRIETHNHYHGSPKHNSTESDEGRLKILVESLKFQRMDARLHNVKSAHAKTCKWLFRHQAFLKWNDDSKRQDHNGFLWIKGKPGCGKSTIMKAVLEWANKNRKKRSWIIVSYFFNARAPGVLEKSTLGLYRSLVHQILQAVPGLKSPLSDMFSWKSISEEIEWTVTELQEFLRQIISDNERPSLCVLIDALDEGKEEDVRDMIGFLEDLSSYTDTGPSLSICLSSRHYPHITIKKGVSLVVEEQREHDQDIATYVHDRLSHLQETEAEDLRAQLCGKSAGIFLWVVLVIPILNQIYDEGQGLNALKRYLKILPPDLEGLFAKILARDAKEVNACVSLLQWVLYSIEPLSSTELYLAIQHSLVHADDQPILVPDDARLARYLVHNSRGLVEVTKSQPPLVQFIHETVREFLVGESRLAQVDRVLVGNLEGWSHAKLVQACLCYFTRIYDQLPRIRAIRPSFNWDFEGTNFYTTDDQFRRNLEDHFPFIKYVTYYLLQHAEMAQQHGISQTASLQLLSVADSQLNHRWRHLHNAFEKHNLRRYRGNVTWLYVAAELNLNALTKVLAWDNGVLNTKCGRYGNALQAACHNGNQDLAQFLIDRGADINAEGGEHRHVVVTAAHARHCHLLKLLHERGARPSQDIFLWALRAAVNVRSVEVAATLLGMGADLNTCPKLATTLTPLVAAINYMDIQMATFLLDRGANTNASPCGPDSFHRLTPLTAAIRTKRVDIVNLILDKSDLSQPLPYVGCVSALTEAAFQESTEVIDLLLKRGVSFENGEEAQKVLILAAHSGHLELTRRAIAYGVNIDNALNWNQALMTLLLFGKTAMMVAVEKGHYEMVQLLIEHGANVNIRIRAKGFSPLSLAISHSRPEILGLLLNAGARPDLEIDHLKTTVEFVQKCEYIVSYFLEEGANNHAETIRELLNKCRTYDEEAATSLFGSSR